MLVDYKGIRFLREAVVAPISHDLILGRTWLHGTNSVIDCKKRTLTFELDQRPFATSSEALRSLWSHECSRDIPDSHELAPVSLTLPFCLP